MNGIDIEKLTAAVKRKLSDEKIPVSEAVKQTGITSSTFYRIVRGKATDSDNLLRICRWLNTPFERFTTGEPERVVFYEESETLDKIEALIAADRNLEESDRRKLIEIFRSQYQIITNLGK